MKPPLGYTPFVVLRPYRATESLWQYLPLRDYNGCRLSAILSSEVGLIGPFESGRPGSQKPNGVSTRPRQQRHYPYQRGSPRPSNSSRSSAQDQAQGLCPVCLSKPHENMSKCRKDTLSDGKPARSLRNEFGQLVNENGKTLCVDFQRPEGCTGGCRGPRHRCSGCGESQHGAADCPRRAHAR